MIMKIDKVFTYCSLLFLIILGLSSCIGQNEDLQEESYGAIDLSVNTETSIGVNSRVLPQEVNTDLLQVMLYKGDIKQSVGVNTYGEWKVAPVLVLNADNYKIKVENCSFEEAESANGGKGSIRVAGESDVFAVNDETKEVQVSCKMVNAAFGIRFDEAFSETDCSVILVAEDNAERSVVLSSDDTSYAYFNIPDVDAGRKISFKIQVGENTKSGSCILNPADVAILNVGISGDTSDSFVTIEVNGEVEEVTLDNIFNPYV